MTFLSTGGPAVQDRPARRPVGGLVLCLTLLASVLLPATALAEPVGTITYLGKRFISGTTFITDVAGYYDPVADKEYALICDNYDGLFVLDVSNPANPQVVGQNPGVPGFDVKVWGHYGYLVNGGGTGMGAVVDLTYPWMPTKVGEFPSSHNIFISDAGFMYLEYPGLRIYDLNANPANPVLEWTAPPPSSAHPEASAPEVPSPAHDLLAWFELHKLNPLYGPEHDDDEVQVVGGHDATVVGNTLYDFHGYLPTRIWNVADPTSPVLLGTIDDPAIKYHHSGWPTKDGKHLVVNDELAKDPTPDFTVWNVENPGSPYKVGEWSDPGATIHNMQVDGNIGFVSYYTAGFRTFNLTNPASPSLVDEYDTSFYTGEQFQGAFGVDAFLPSGIVLVSDWDRGLFIFDVQRTGTQLPLGIPELDPTVSLRQNNPNPFNPNTTITYDVARDAELTLQIFNARGQLVKTLYQGFRGAGTYSVPWNATSDDGRSVASGVYFYRIESGRFSDTRQMILVK